MSSRQLDAVVVGAGFGGRYMLHRLRKLGLTTLVVDAGYAGFGKRSTAA